MPSTWNKALTRWLPIEPRHGREAIALPQTGLPSGHRDPFDRLLSANPNFGRYDVAVVW